MAELAGYNFLAPDLFSGPGKGESHGTGPCGDEVRLRESFLNSGKGVLGNCDLIAMLIGSGTIGASALEVSKEIMASVDHDLKRLSSLTHEDLVKFNGVGPAKSGSILAALQLGKRAFGII